MGQSKVRKHDRNRVQRLHQHVCSSQVPVHDAQAVQVHHGAHHLQHSVQQHAHGQTTLRTHQRVSPSKWQEAASSTQSGTRPLRDALECQAPYLPLVLLQQRIQPSLFAHTGKQADFAVRGVQANSQHLLQVLTDTNPRGPVNNGGPPHKLYKQGEPRRACNTLGWGSNNRRSDRARSFSMAARFEQSTALAFTATGVPLGSLICRTAPKDPAPSCFSKRREDHAYCRNVLCATNGHVGGKTCQRTLVFVQCTSATSHTPYAREGVRTYPLPAPAPVVPVPPGLHGVPAVLPQGSPEARVMEGT